MGWESEAQKKKYLRNCGWKISKFDENYTKPSDPEIQWNLNM